MAKRGIALITTLMVAGLMMLLLAAFIQVNRGQFALLGVSSDREAVLRTAFSIHEYCVNRIERDKTWGSANFSASVNDPSLGDKMSVTEVQGGKTITGALPSLRSTFEVTVDNRLAGEERVVLEMTITTTKLTRKIQSVLRPAPLFDGGMAAGGGLRVDADEWTVASKDPYRNMVRARGDIQAPDYGNVHFEGRANSDGDTGVERGIFWSKQDVNFSLGGTAVSVTDPDVMRDAVLATGGQFFANSGISHSLHDLQVSDIIAPATTTEVMQGEYRFTEATASYENYEQVGTDSDGNPVYDWVPRQKQIPILGRYLSSLSDYWYSTDTLPSNIRNLDLGLPGTSHEEVSSTFSLDAGAKVEVTLDLPNTRPTFNILAEGQVEIPGSFSVTSTGDEPRLSFAGSNGNAQIKAQGDVTFEGELVGNGLILSRTGNVNLKVNQADVTGNALGISIFAANDIDIEAKSGGGDLSFHGLLYARENVTVLADAQNLIVDGALIARNGSIDISTAGKVDVTYNPEHLEVLLESLPDNRTKLETLLWRE